MGTSTVLGRINHQTTAATRAKTTRAMTDQNRGCDSGFWSRSIRKSSKVDFEELIGKTAYSKAFFARRVNPVSLAGRATEFFGRTPGRQTFGFCRKETKAAERTNSEE